MNGRFYFKGLARWLIAWVVYYTGFLRIWCRLSSGSGPIILAYHRVVDRTAGEGQSSLPGLNVDAKSFRRQMEYLARHYKIVSLEELVELMARGVRVGGHVAITFDDGWRDNYTNAYPVLRLHRAPATVFLVTDYVGTSHWFWPEKTISLLKTLKARKVRIPTKIRKKLGGGFDCLPDPREVTCVDNFIERLKRLPDDDRESVVAYLSGEAGVPPEDLERERLLLGWDEVQIMTEGGVSFGSHTCTHPIMTEIPLETAREEVVNSKRRIEERTGVECTAFAYPDGGWNEDVRDLVIESGYRCACSVSRTRSEEGADVFTLKRITIHDGFSAGFNGGFSRCVFGVQISGFFKRPLRCTIWSSRKENRYDDG